MKTKILLAVVSATLLVSTTSVVAAETKTEKAPPKPTGACTITTYGITPTCTPGMHRDSCYALGTKTGSVADWSEGKPCPKK